MPFLQFSLKEEQVEEYNIYFSGCKLFGLVAFLLSLENKDLLISYKFKHFTFFLSFFQILICLKAGTHWRKYFISWWDLSTSGIFGGIFVSLPHLVTHSDFFVFVFVPAKVTLKFNIQLSLNQTNNVNISKANGFSSVYWADFDQLYNYISKKTWCSWDI